MDKPILTRQEALAIGYVHYYTGKPCKHGHDSERYTKSRTCIECNRLKWQRRPKEKRQEYWQNYYTEEVKNRKVENARKQREINPFKPRKLRSERKTRVRQATIRSKADQIRVQEMYLEAQKLTLETGIEHCVDHIIPIAHPDVCGLHTFANLQIITSEENRKKGQHFDPTEHEFIAEKS
jgi:Na+-translocating ferredoxin:NAD+ oxidoreductase RnfC subunit